MKRFYFFIYIIGLYPGIAPAQTRVACIGNSITAGSWLTDPAKQSYPAVLQNLLGTSYKVQNYGVGGATLLKKGNKPYWTTGKLPLVFSFKPDIVTIKLGSNDSKAINWDAQGGAFKRDYLAMIDTLNALSSKPRIFLVLPVPAWANQFAIRDSVVRLIVAVIREIAAERQLPLIDCNTPFLQGKSFFPDGVHPDSAGADSIAHIVYRAISTPVRVEKAAPRPFGMPAAFRVDMTGGALSFGAPAGARYTIEIMDPAGRTLRQVSGSSAGSVRCSIRPDARAPGVGIYSIFIDGRFRKAVRGVDAGGRYFTTE